LSINPKQKLLLQACVLQGKPVLDAWEEWKNAVDIEQLDAASNALLSQLYCNLATHQVDDFQMARLKGIYKRNWYGNQLLLKKLQTILQTCQTSKMDTVVLGDASIVAGYGKDCCQHPLEDINILVHPVDLEKAIAILAQAAWNLVERQYSYGQLQDEAKTKLHLRGDLFWAIPQEHTRKQLWANAFPCQIGDINTFILSLTDLFLHLSLRTFLFRYNPKHYWFSRWDASFEAASSRNGLD
ncbi:MAG: nucleotidyltransferase family protein, partial [Hydrococcus sp. SU_1_0]|nr:nucleotidyltransferase family protein [Hydrococcus sp. SU_1_0]